MIPFQIYTTMLLYIQHKLGNYTYKTLLIVFPF